jgi:hypothetical protein
MKNANRKASRSGKIDAGYFFKHYVRFTQMDSHKKHVSTTQNPLASNNTSDQLQELINRCGKYGKWLSVIADNQGILTHSLSDHGLKSNNAHNMSQYVNPRIIPLGWVVAKTVHTKANESWSWHLWPISYAIKQPISDSLRAMILQYMEAANDE